MEWLQVEQNWVLTPPKPQGVIHFLGGAFFAAAPQIAYRRLLEKFASHGYVIVATPFANNTFDHGQIAAATYKSFQKARSKLFLDYFPVYGLGHSMGCKVHLLLNCYYNCDRAGNIFIAYNNYSASQSVPLFKELSGTIPEMAEMEFYPSPSATRDLIDRQYKIRNNLLVRFFDDNIDEITDLSRQLKLKFPNTVKVQALPGTHLTSMGIDFNWQTGGSFTPLDAIGQWLKQGMHKNNHTLEQVILRWLATNKPDRKGADNSTVASSNKIAD